MRRLLLPAIILISTFALSQSNPPDSQDMRALLEEVRQLRRDLQATAVAGQRVQIALYRLQAQDAMVARATRTLEESRSKQSELATDRKQVLEQMEQIEEIRTRTQDSGEKQALEQAVPALKRRLEQLASDDQQWQAKVNEAEVHLKFEESKLNNLQDALDRLDQALESSVGRAAKIAPPGK
jgi:chromosome segregation ATPase